MVLYQQPISIHNLGHQKKVLACTCGWIDTYWSMMEQMFKINTYPVHWDMEKSYAMRHGQQPIGGKDKLL